MESLLHKNLQQLVDVHLRGHSIWQSHFFQALERSDDSKKTWTMLTMWVENMIRASYGFQTYILLLASRAPEEKIRRLLIENAWEEMGDYEYPKRSHFQMVSRLATLCGISDEYLNHCALKRTDFPTTEVYASSTRKTSSPSVPSK